MGMYVMEICAFRGAKWGYVRYAGGVLGAGPNGGMYVMQAAVISGNGRTLCTLCREGGSQRLDGKTLCRGSLWCGVKSRGARVPSHLLWFKAVMAAEAPPRPRSEELVEKHSRWYGPRCKLQKCGRDESGTWLQVRTGRVEHSPVHAPVHLSTVGV